MPRSIITSAKPLRAQQDARAVRQPQSTSLRLYWRHSQPLELPDPAGPSPDPPAGRHGSCASGNRSCPSPQSASPPAPSSRFPLSQFTEHQPGPKIAGHVSAGSKPHGLMGRWCAGKNVFNDLLQPRRPPSAEETLSSRRSLLSNQGRPAAKATSTCSQNHKRRATHGARVGRRLPTVIRMATGERRAAPAGNPTSRSAKLARTGTPDACQSTSPRLDSAVRLALTNRVRMDTIALTQHGR